MDRILEPELMTDAAQALAYAEADFAQVNQGFVDRFRACFPKAAGGSMVDLGCGPGDIPVRFARALPGFTITAVDGSEPMIALAEKAVKAAGVEDRVRPRCARLPILPLPLQSFDAVVSNSLVHHMPDPYLFWNELVRLGKPGATVLIMDLLSVVNTNTLRPWAPALRHNRPRSDATASGTPGADATAHIKAASSRTHRARRAVRHRMPAHRLRQSIRDAAAAVVPARRHPFGPGRGHVPVARSFRMTAGSCSVAISRSRPPQCRHARTSIAKDRNGGRGLGEDTAPLGGREHQGTDELRSSRRRRERSAATPGATERLPAGARRSAGPSARPTRRA